MTLLAGCLSLPDHCAAIDSLHHAVRCKVRACGHIIINIARTHASTHTHTPTPYMRFRRAPTCVRALSRPRCASPTGKPYHMCEKTHKMYRGTGQKCAREFDAPGWPVFFSHPPQMWQNLCGLCAKRISSSLSLCVRARVPTCVCATPARSQNTTPGVRASAVRRRVRCDDSRDRGTDDSAIIGFWCVRMCVLVLCVCTR